MRCQKHPESWIGLNGPGYCQECARERTALGPSDVTACSPSLTPETDDFFCNPPENEGAFQFARKLEIERDAAIRIIEQIEERYIDGCDTYEDWKFMGGLARNFICPENP